jgi:hypothetical protein
VVGCYQLKDPTTQMVSILAFTSFHFHDIAHVQQFHQDYIGLPENGAPNAPKHVGARLYTNTRLFECILLVFHSPYENALSKLEKKATSNLLIIF